ncbi:hypothetical protein WOLCODRAFT_115523 [Wolfiporia cocos MD-104 SS10]|uniref:DUF6593 domain-containing protein n=1 Tax=Wolfiporia cocos (strain MD-104) TaxID=742152 RepID=A0A2H3JI81_WOLCO|nr:hypothetical protein WOLCODRAFT_115523 [Wolfiporia cocos MD-104 SS10]
MAAAGPNHLFFTSKDDPREDCIIIGFTYNAPTNQGSDKPIFYRFTTSQVSQTDSRTIVTRDAGQVVAQLDWPMHNQLGMITMGTKPQHPMSWMMMRGSTPNVRIFRSADSQLYEWRKVLNRPDSYDLFSGNTQIARFQREAKNTPIGPAHAVMQYIFDNDELLLECLVALCVNRWVDLRLQ